MTSYDNQPPLDGWVCYPRPNPFDAPTVYETAEDDNLSPLIELGEN